MGRHEATHYEVLGVAWGAADQEIRQAYHRMARRHHPDAHGPASAAVLDAARRKMVAINAAWSVLGDPERRRDYDAGLGHRPVHTTRPAGGGGSGGSAGPEFPDWFEPDDRVPAAHLEEDIDEEVRRGLADFVVFVPVGIAALSVTTFAFSLVVQWPGLFAVSVMLLPVAVVSFILTPLVVIATRVRSRS